MWQNLTKFDDVEKNTVNKDLVIGCLGDQTGKLHLKVCFWNLLH